jgi:hypothetical protein
MMLPGGVLPWSALEATAARIAALGWHIDLQLDGRALPRHAAMLGRLPCRLVVDHVGRFLGPVSAESDAVRALLGLLDAGACWVKISAVPVGEQLAASQSAPAADRCGDARLGVRLHRRRRDAAQDAGRQPRRALRFHGLAATKGAPRSPPTGGCPGGGT